MKSKLIRLVKLIFLEYSGSQTIQNDKFLYELPKNLRSKSKLSFLDYALDIGGYMDSNTGEMDPIIKNSGLYLMKPKRKLFFQIGFFQIVLFEFFEEE